MAIEVTIGSTIDAPADHVFEAVADLEAWPTWLIASGIRSVARASDGPLAAGERLVVEQNAAGRAGTFEAEVSALEPGRRLALHGRDAEGVTIDIDAVIERPAAQDGATTELRWTLRIGVPMRYRIFESMARPQVERAALLDVEALRRMLERPAED
jgi:uncharacterized protein YndB with AHSA1/START domain